MRSLALLLCLVVVIAVSVTPCGASVAHETMTRQDANVAVNIGINYGNGTIRWHNGTIVPSGEFLLNATMRLATVEFTNYAGFTGPGLPGAFVTSINGVRQNPAANLYWMVWVYDPTTQRYKMGQVGAGSYALTSDQTIQWYYQNTGSLTNPALQPYTSVSFNARLASSTNPPTAVMSGAIYPAPGGPVNVTLEYSSNQGANYQEIALITSAPDGTFSYSWKLPSSGIFLIRADAQGVKSQSVSLGTTSGVAGFPVESLVLGIALGLCVGILGRKRRPRKA
jgi:hypothetical protein